jgi:hypothetical protein
MYIRTEVGMATSRDEGSAGAVAISGKFAPTLSCCLKRVQAEGDGVSVNRQNLYILRSNDWQRFEGRIRASLPSWPISAKLYLYTGP